MMSGRNKSVVVVLHLMVWLVLFGLPYFLSSGQTDLVQRIATRTWIPLVFYAVIFYLNYFWCIPKFLFDKKTVLFVVINIVVIAFFVWLANILRSHFFLEKLPPPPGDAPPKRFFLYIEAVSFTVPLVFSVALKATERWVKTEAERRDIANIKLESELQHLKYQLQPHFFFNALNNIYALVDISPETAKEAIHSLGKLMRYLLYDTNTGQISLRQEVDFMDKYIALMKLRYSDNIRVYVDFPKVDTGYRVAPLLFISLVENAFKHGVSAGFETDISFEMKLEKEHLSFRATNRNLPKSDSDKSGSGIGLANLEKRLQLLYPDTYNLHYGVQGDQFVALLTLKLS